MLIGQASINPTANVLSALLGLASVCGQCGVASDLSHIGRECGRRPIAHCIRTMTTRGAGATAEHMADSFELLLVVIGPVAIWLAICGPSFAGAVMGEQFATSASLLLPTLALARFLARSRINTFK